MSAISTSSVCRPKAAEDLLEGASEILVEDRVDHGVQTAVAIAKPEEEFEQSFGNVAAFATDGDQAVGEEERKPAQYEDTHDHCEYKREALFPGRRKLASKESGSSTGVRAQSTWFFIFQPE